VTTLLERFRAHLDVAGLFREPGTAIVAVSGGPDSVALLDLLHAVAAERSLALVVAHADHGIQAASRSVGQAVRGLAERYGLPFEVAELQLGPDASETVARRARYAWLREVQRRRAARYLVTAHHQDDQVETVLLRVLRGSAPAGLAGIPMRGRGGLVRPLLAFTRAELAAHIVERGLPAHQDPANRDPRHLRSWIRLELLPLIERRHGPASRADLLRLARAAAEERRAWGRVLELVPELGLRREPHGFAVARQSLARYDSALSVALLRAAARQVGLVLGPARAHRLVRLASGASGRQLPLGAGWIAEVAFGELRVYRGFEGATEQVVARSARGDAVFGGFRVAWRPEPAPQRVERAGWTTWIAGTGWELRAPRAGDRVLPLGGVGHRAVRRLLMEARVPRSKRWQYPVVVRGETILWVPGVCRSAADLPGHGTAAVRLDVIRNGEFQ
jgi:tRNA(Ile)-lysidine synthase